MFDNKNKKLIILLSIITGLFLIIAIYLVYFQIFNAPKLNADSRNARNFVDESSIKRGTIYDIKGRKLAYSEKVDDSYERFNTYSYMYSNIIGYTDSKLGKSGIEAKYNKQLLDITNNADIFTKLDTLVDGKNPNDIYLTIDDDIQSRIWDIFGNNHGSVIVTKPKTGEIVAMVSKPSFNVKNLREEWEEIIASNDAILLNRATQGLYEPGSIYKVFTAIVFLRSNIDLKYYDKGHATVADYTVNNLGNVEYGDMTLEKALNVSSNTYFFEKSTQVSNKLFVDTWKDFGIGKNYDFALDRSESIIPFKEGLSDLEKANAAFGQGKTYVTPLDMMQIAMGIANDGVVYQPYLIDKIVRNGVETATTPKILSSNIEAKYAKLVREYLRTTAVHNNFKLNNEIELAGKTGSAESSKNDNIWYLAMAPANNPEYAIIVNIENTTATATSLAAPIAVEILNYIFSKR